MPAFWRVPKGIWTIDFEEENSETRSIRIYVKCNGEAVAWGGMDYLDEMVTKFRRYQWASGKPDCARCGHEYYDHLNLHNAELQGYDPGTPWRHGLSACNWGGGHEGSCGCEGYVNSQPRGFCFPNRPCIPTKDAQFDTPEYNRWESVWNYLRRLNVRK